MDGAYKAKIESYGGGKDSKSSNNNKNDVSSPCPHCKKSNHMPRRCWWRPDIKCRKCGNMGHMERVCKSQQLEAAKVSIEPEEEEQLFVATCFVTNNNSSDSNDAAQPKIIPPNRPEIESKKVEEESLKDPSVTPKLSSPVKSESGPVTATKKKDNSDSEASNSWLIDSGCTNHMTNDQALFTEIDKTLISKIKIGNGEFISVKGKGTVAIESLTGLKHITDVLYVPDIDKNLLSVGQLIEKGFKVIFEDKWCLIKDARSKDVFKVKMRAKGFVLNLMEDTTRQYGKQDLKI